MTTDQKAGPDPNRMMAIINRLAADEFTGRQAGTPGGHAAARWLATQLQAAGATVTYDEFPVSRAVRALAIAPVLSWTDGTSEWQLTHRREFAEHLASAYLPQPATGPLTRIGHHNSKGAWLLDTAFSADRAQKAATLGAQGIVLPRGVDESGWMPKMVGGPPIAKLPIISVREDIHQQMTAAAHAGVGELTASVPLRPIDITAINVHGTFITAPPGQTSILLTAHYDGVGDDPGGLRHPAACDNATGVAAVIETARLLAATHPGIGVAVALLDGEEGGLHGSTRHASQVSAGTYVINLDGAAALDGPASVEAGGPAHQLLLALDHAGRKTGILLQAHAMRSDNRRYAAAGLPTIGIGMGMPGYQTPAETPDRVRPQTLTAAVKLLLSTVDRLITAPMPIDITEIDRTELAALIQQNAITTVEALPEPLYAQGHLPDAVNIRPRRVAELAPQLLPDQNAAIVVYCGDATCDASLRVARHLTQLGYTNVLRYTGGKQDWTQSGHALHHELASSDQPTQPPGSIE